MPADKHLAVEHDAEIRKDTLPVASSRRVNYVLIEVRLAMDARLRFKLSCTHCCSPHAYEHNSA
jgi:hypothetical protein